MKNKKMILDTATCKVFHEREGVVLYMKMKNGGWVKNNPYTADLKGIIGALTLSLDVLAGKVWPNEVVADPEGKVTPKQPAMLGMGEVDTDDYQNSVIAGEE